MPPVEELRLEELQVESQVLLAVAVAVAALAPPVRLERVDQKASLVSRSAPSARNLSNVKLHPLAVP
jgi:hypothetical protein